jgi:dsRNA-specific ribonuclease
LKIFGDVFESIIGAIFLDSRNIEETVKVMFNLLDPYIKVYANLDTMQDHSRTKLLELWNSKPYTKHIKCNHKSVQSNNQNDTQINGIIGTIVVLPVTYEKDAKNKIRSFYKLFYKVCEFFL